MATAAPVEYVGLIGDTAGIVWQSLTEDGPLSMNRLVKRVEEPRDTVMQALGWLAREGKIDIEEEGRKRVVSLR